MKEFEKDPQTGLCLDMEDEEIILRDGVVYPKVPILGSRAPFRICPSTNESHCVPRSPCGDVTRADLAARLG
jgi:hypothetical protein